MFQLSVSTTVVVYVMSLRLKQDKNKTSARRSARVITSRRTFQANICSTCVAVSPEIAKEFAYNTIVAVTDRASVCGAMLHTHTSPHMQLWKLALVNG